MSDLPARVAVLEQIAKEMSATLKEIKDDLKGLRSDVAGLTARVAGLEGKVSNLPTTWAMLTTFVGALVGVGGLALALARFLPHS